MLQKAHNERVICESKETVYSGIRPRSRQQRGSCRLQRQEIKITILMLTSPDRVQSGGTAVARTRVEAGCSINVSEKKSSRRYQNLRGSYHKWLLPPRRHEMVPAKGLAQPQNRGAVKGDQTPDRHLQCPRKHVLTGYDVDRTFVASWSDTIGESSDLCG